MNDIVVSSFDRYDVDVIDVMGNHIIYHGIAGGEDGIMPTDTFVSKRYVGKTVWITVHHYHGEIEIDDYYVAMPDATETCSLYFDIDYNLTDSVLGTEWTKKEYKDALEICRQYDQLMQYVPYIIRWLHDHDDQSEEVLRL